MVMPLSGTFAYSTTVPAEGLNGFPWEMKSLEALEHSGDALTDKRLIGWSPLVYICEPGSSTNPMPSASSGSPSEIRLVATDKKYASGETASYFLDRALVSVLRSGDVFNITRTNCGGVGASAIRRGKLVFAVGAVTSVPLGSDVVVRTPYDLLQKAQTVLRSRDPKFEFAQHPLEVCIGNSLRIWYRGLMRMSGYHIWIEHGFIPGEPGTEESVSITLDESCDWVAGRASAQLLTNS